MLPRFLLSPLTIVGIVLFLAAGELASGTQLPFVAMMVVAMLAVCVTYNMLGGLSTIGGIFFTVFALYTLVVSQFAKVLIFEPADLNLRSPELTIGVYAVYFVSLMVGVFLFGWIRLSLPKPLEPSTARHSGLMYLFSFVVGLAAQIYMANYSLEHPGLQGATSHGLARALAYLLPLSLVIAVDARIRKTDGRHCFGWAALLPALAIELMGFTAGSRIYYILPPLIVAVTAYFRGFRFSTRHYLIAGALAAGLFLVVSPWYLWSRAFRRQPNLEVQLETMASLAAAAPQHWQQVAQAVRANMQSTNGEAEEYLTRVNSTTLDRMILIPDDGAVISACAHYHWGFETFRLDADSSIPHFLQKKKPDRQGVWLRASVGGLQSSYEENFYITTSTIADAWGGFGWAGVIGVPLVLVPLLFIVYESIFDISRPWGTVAVVSVALNLTPDGVGSLVVGQLLVIPIYILAISWFAGWITRSIPMTGDSSLRTGAPLLRPVKVSSGTGD